MTPLVLVTGPPASGKTTLATRLAHDFRLPLLTKDAIKERLFDELGTGDLAWSQRLGRTAMALLWDAVAVQAVAASPAIAEAPFHRSFGSSDLACLVEAHPVSVLQILRVAPAGVLMERHVEREPERHGGHLDAERLPLVAKRLDGALYELAGAAATIVHDSTDADAYAAAHAAVVAHLAL